MDSTQSPHAELESAEYPFKSAAGRVLKFYFPKGDIIGQVVRTTREWDFRFISNLYKWAGERGTFLEVGANIGTETALAREFFRYCFAFEPSSRNRDLFKKNMERNGIDNVQLFPFAVSDHTEVTQLYLGGENNVGSCALKPNASGMDQTEEVRTVTLDAAMAPEITDVSFIHIDTEGHDIKVLQGAKMFLRRQQIRPIIRMEFQPRTLALHGSSIEDLLQFIQEFGYKIGFIAALHMAPLSERVLIELFNLWQPTGAWIDIFLLP
jgi:FkbM family methyltransferase